MHILLILSDEDQEPVDKQVEEDDRVDCNQVFLGVYDHVHEGNGT
jgi:hypothetical protein